MDSYNYCYSQTPEDKTEMMSRDFRGTSHLSMSNGHEPIYMPFTQTDDTDTAINFDTVVVDMSPAYPLAHNHTYTVPLLNTVQNNYMEGSGSATIK